MGWPVAHSRSPALHGFWLAEHGIDGAYVPLAVQPEHLRRALEALPLLGFAGCNLTIPHKEAALEAVDEIDAVGAPRRRRQHRRRRGRTARLRGSNTDGFGFLENLRAERAGLERRVRSGGGARRRRRRARHRGGADRRRRARDPARQPHARRGRRRWRRSSAAPVRGVAWEDRGPALAGAALLVNATSLGMAGQPALDLALDALAARAPWSTTSSMCRSRRRCSRRRGARGNPAVDGLGMLLHQGAARLRRLVRRRCPR